MQSIVLNVQRMSAIIPTNNGDIFYNRVVYPHASLSVLAHGTLKELQNLPRSKSNIELNTSIC